LADKETITILGAGSWGNTLSCLYSDTFNILLYDYNSKRAAALRNKPYFTQPIERQYPENVSFTSDLTQAMSNKYVLNAVPIKHNIKLFKQIAALGLDLKGKILINTSKGIDIESMQCPSEYIHRLLPELTLAGLCGPNLAIEVLQKKPMIATIATQDLELARELRIKFSAFNYRLYASDDLIGLELCSAFKNVIAIAAGAADGLELGASTKASLITRALNENLTLLKSKGGEMLTLYSACGIGDLIATSNSTLSRNYRVGYFLAKDFTMPEIKEKLQATAEGINTARAVFSYARKYNLDLPITEQVKKLVDEEITVKQMIPNLMNRNLNNIRSYL
jgi:glycerol-3-phosphate dehydrogenase (NAD(P)+)